MPKRIHQVLAILVRVLGISALCVAAALVFSVIWAKDVEHRAEATFSDFLKLEVGRSTFADLDKLRQRHGGSIVTIRWKDCIPEHCAYQFSFQNSSLYRLHLAPHVRFGLSLVIENNRLTQREMTYGVDPVDTPGTQATHVTETYTIVTEAVPEEMMRGLDPLPCSKDFRIAVHIDSRAHPLHYQIWMNTDAPSDYRERAYSIDLRCLSRIGECDRGAILAPFYDGAPCSTALGSPAGAAPRT